MRMYDIIKRKRDGFELSESEINFFISGYVAEKIPDYQVSALLMAIFFRGMSRQETFSLTKEMANSGEWANLSGISGPLADKHSTGGVGDKTSLIIAPICAACGIKMAKMSGRSLGHTGGTIDKLESISGYRSTLSQKEFFDTINATGLSIISQTGTLAPADKLIYALRDMTATVDSLPLIAASIMSKKIAGGADSIMLDVKVGSGAFMKNADSAFELAQIMCDIGRDFGRKMSALITDMDIPLGRNIGNALEVAEAVETLKGGGASDLREICIALSAGIIESTLNYSHKKSVAAANEALDSGKAFSLFREMIIAQGGDISQIDNTEKLPKTKLKRELTASESGYISKIDTEKCGLSALSLGAGRERKEDSINYGAGIILKRRYADFVAAGDRIALLFADTEKQLSDGEKILQEALTISSVKPPKRQLILNKI